MTTLNPAPSDECAQLRTALLGLHRTLVDLERRDYEKQHGQQSAGQFLQLMAYDESMRWLEPLSRLIVMLDEALDAQGKGTDSVAPTVVAQRVRDLLRLNREEPGEFGARYLHHFDQSPDLAVEHAGLLRALNR
ncbi:hypothetical protein [Acidovorax sp. Leaf78]|uniref:hypothetical protein n=1 Tax=Acidovorax sp. Leaf78 TaxID=1736237 RepID=UPI0006F75B24|nr:hypothetical protein [Acidovorax sp. Leaf78]KQO19945.1 hypothetical protein ASF16_08485 [Acidovorax sp. Leaf78]